MSKDATANTIAAVSALIAASAILIGVVTSWSDRTAAAKSQQTALGVSALATFAELDPIQRKVLVGLLADDENILPEYRKKMANELAAAQSKTVSQERFVDAKPDDRADAIEAVGIIDALESSNDTERYKARDDLKAFINTCDNNACASFIFDLLPARTELLSANYRTTIGILVAIHRAETPFNGAPEAIIKEIRDKISLIEANYDDDTMKVRATDALASLE